MQFPVICEMTLGVIAEVISDILSDVICEGPGSPPPAAHARPPCRPLASRPPRLAPGPSAPGPSAPGLRPMGPRGHGPLSPWGRLRAPHHKWPNASCRNFGAISGMGIRSAQPYQDDSQFPKWEERSSKMRWKHRLPPTGGTWISCGTKMRGVRKTPRVVDLVECGWWSVRMRDVLKRNPDWIPRRNSNEFWAIASRGLLCDLSQCMGRSPWTSKKTSCAHCLTTSNMVYSFERDRIVLPIELLAWHAYPTNSVPSASPWPASSEGQL